MQVNDYPTRRRFNLQRRLKILDLASAGLTREEIGREVGCSINSVSRVIVAAGGRPSRRSRRRSRSKNQLTLNERVEIQVSLVSGQSMRQIAKRIGKSPSTISREVKRNRGARSHKATVADDRASRLMARPKASKLSKSPRLRRKVRQGLKDDLSPEQISGRLKRLYPDDPEITGRGT